jgi:hypothetical protein
MEAKVAPPPHELGKYVVVREPQDGKLDGALFPLEAPPDIITQAEATAPDPPSPTEADLRAVDDQLIAAIRAIDPDPLTPQSLNGEAIEEVVVGLPIPAGQIPLTGYPRASGFGCTIRMAQ